MNTALPAQLSEQFSLPGLRWDHGHGELVRAVIDTPAVQGELYLHGAHVTAWQPKGQSPVLWMSHASNFVEGKAIRGGVPICFPWFGPHASDTSLPAHGYARLKAWDIVEASMNDDEGLTLVLATQIASFHLKYTVAFGRSLKMTLRTELPAIAGVSQRFEDALHTYFNVGAIESISVEGLEDGEYIDKVEGAVPRLAERKPIQFVSETDRVYGNSEATCTLRDPTLRRAITVAKTGSLSTVVWNPWIDKSARMSDFGNDEWKSMACIETANVLANAIELQPGQSHETTALISVGEL